MHPTVHNPAAPGSNSGPAPASTGPVDSGEPGARRWPPFDRHDLKRAKAGDPAALGRFFDHHFDHVFSVIYRFVGSREAAQDLTQEVFLKVRRHLGRIDIEADLAPWLYTVTINTCRDHRRSVWWRMSRRSVPLEHGGPLAALPSTVANPEHAMVAAQEARRVQLAISQLPEELRVSVILHDFEGLPHDQIARVTGTSHAAARKRHSRALRQLAGLLAEGEPS